MLLQGGQRLRGERLQFGVAARAGLPIEELDRLPVGLHAEVLGIPLVEVAAVGPAQQGQPGAVGHGGFNSNPDDDSDFSDPDDVAPIAVTVFAITRIDLSDAARRTAHSLTRALTGLEQGVTYYVVAGDSSSTRALSATRGGTAIAIRTTEVVQLFRNNGSVYENRTVTTTIEMHNSVPSADLSHYTLGARNGRWGQPRTTMMLDVVGIALPGGKLVGSSPEKGARKDQERSGLYKGREAKSMLINVPMGGSKTVSFTSTVPDDATKPLQVRYSPTVGETPVTIDGSCGSMFPAS